MSAARPSALRPSGVRPGAAAAQHTEPKSDVTCIGSRRAGSQRRRQHLKTSLRARDRLEIRMSDSTSDSPKPSDPSDNADAKIRNRETSYEAGFTVSSVVYKAAGVDHRYIDTSINFLLYLQNRTID